MSLTYERGKEKFEARIDLGANSYVGDNQDLDLTRANAKALGLVNPNNKDLDGYILMSDLSGVGVSWNQHRSGFYLQL